MQVSLTRMDLFYYGLRRLLTVNLYMLVVMSCFRLFFTYYFADAVIFESYLSDLMYAFYMGGRYDLMVTSYSLVVPFLLLSFAAFSGSKCLMNIMLFISGAFLFNLFLIISFLLASDLAFYSYFQDHINILFFGLFEDDTSAVLLSIWKNYPAGKVLVGILFYAFVQYKLFKYFFRFIKNENSVFHFGIFKVVTSFAVTLLLLVAGARGSFTDLVLSPRYAEFSKSEFINQVAINGVITFERAVKLRSSRNGSDFNMARHMGYSDSIHRAFSDHIGVDTAPTSKEHLVSLLERKTAENFLAQEVSPHVIVFIMESFGAFWSRYNTSEFNFMGELKRHFSEDFYFENFISSDNGTIGSLMAIATNIPNRPGARFLSESRYMQLPLESAAHIPFKRRGYETRFLYGGKLGWRDIGKYFKYQQYHFVDGEGHIRDELRLSGNVGTEWGVYDEHFFDYVYKKLEKAKRPQFLLGLTTTNHPPFEISSSFKAPSLIIPPALQKRIIREEGLVLERFKAFQYANYKLAEFIQKVKASKLSENTIIAVTGDHNFWGFINYTKEESFDKYKVPFYLYIPEKLRPASDDNSYKKKFGSHEDMMPTLYNLSLSKTKYIAFGRDLFGDNASYALNGNIYAGEKGLYYKNKFYNWQKNTTLLDLENNSSPLKELERYFKSTLTVADFYLRDRYEKNSKKSKSTSKIQ